MKDKTIEIKKETYTREQIKRNVHLKSREEWIIVIIQQELSSFLIKWLY